jgi:hypothetical protein
MKRSQETPPPRSPSSQKLRSRLEGTDYVHLWTITELALEERIVYRWRYEGYQGDSRVAWHLADWIWDCAHGTQTPEEGRVARPRAQHGGGGAETGVA